MTPRELLMLVWMASILAWMVAFLPSIFYVARLWPLRKEDIVSSFSREALAEYYALYFPIDLENKKSDPDPIVRFEKDYGRKYGRRRFILPITFLILVCGAGLWGVRATTAIWLTAGLGEFILPPIAVSAFLGGYTWVVSDQLARLRSGDFGPGDVNNAVFRLLIAIPFGYALSALVKDDMGIATAFLVGSFPTSTLFTIARRLGNKQLGLGDDGATGTSELELLQNVGKTNAERFSDEGVTTIAELAWTDPISLSVHTNFEFNYVVDCMSQSLLAVYVGSDTSKLAKFSLRGAQEVVAMVDILESAPEDSRYSAKQKSAASVALAGAAKALGIDAEALYHTLTFVAQDPYTSFLWQIWGTSTPAPADAQPVHRAPETPVVPAALQSPHEIKTPAIAAVTRVIENVREKRRPRTLDAFNERVVKTMYDELRARGVLKNP